MLINFDNFEIEKESLNDIIDSLECYSDQVSLGNDIDDIQKSMFSPELVDKRKSCDLFLAWVSRQQPCLFGRMGASGRGNVLYDICWLDTQDIKKGDQYLCDKIQIARRKWKDRASEGLSSGFLIMLQDKRISRAKPSNRLLEVCRRACELYIVENAPLQCDTIYTESIPLQVDGRYGVFKAGINIFYPGAHRTLNNDRRVPGGLLISVNSPGYLAHSLLRRKLTKSLKESVQWIYKTAMHSIGNGGIGGTKNPSNSWHNTVNDPVKLRGRCPIKHRATYIPSNYSGRTYSATYHTDVLLPTDATVKSELDPNLSKHEIWPWLVIDYISEKKVPTTHVNYGLFHPHPISPEARYHNPWPPRIARNEPLFQY